MATISTSSSQVDIVDQSLLSGALHLPVASRSIRCGKALRQRRACLPLRAFHAARPYSRSPRPLHLISTSSEGGILDTESHPRPARGVGLVRQPGRQGEVRGRWGCGLPAAHASVYTVPQAREFNAKFKSGLLPKFR